MIFGGSVETLALSFCYKCSKVSEINTAYIEGKNTFYIRRKNMKKIKELFELNELAKYTIRFYLEMKLIEKEAKKYENKRCYY